MPMPLIGRAIRNLCRNKTASASYSPNMPWLLIGGVTFGAGHGATITSEADEAGRYDFLFGVRGFNERQAGCGDSIGPLKLQPRSRPASWQRATSKDADPPPLSTVRAVVPMR